MLLSFNLFDGTQMLMHQVYFWLENPDSEDDRAQLIAGVRGLHVIAGVQSLAIGTPSLDRSRGVVDATWDVSETIHFAGPAEQAAYQDDPAHLAFVAECGHLWRKVLVYDSMLVD